MHFYTFFNHFYGALLSLYRSWADRTKFDFVSSLIALRSLSQEAPKWRFAQERRAIERFQRAMCPALIIGTGVQCTGATFGPYWLDKLYRYVPMYLVNQETIKDSKREIWQKIGESIPSLGTGTYECTLYKYILVYWTSNMYVVKWESLSLTHVHCTKI